MSAAPAAAALATANPGQPGWRHVLLGALALGCSAPPALVPGAEFLVLVGLAAWFAVATRSPRPCWHTYLLGCGFMAWFSWSLQHVLLAAYVAVIVVGGLYFVLATVATRAVPRAFAVPAFAIAAAASFWLRAEMPEICYPHGQPAHCLWQWPALLVGLRIGGEPLMNALLAGFAAAAVQLWRSWRLAQPGWCSARRSFVGVMAVGATVLGLGQLWRAPLKHADATIVHVGVVEPGLHPLDAFAGFPPVEARARYRELFEQRWLGPTRALLAQSTALDLVLWPESSLWQQFLVDELVGPPNAATRELDFGLELGTARLVVGANLRVGSRSTPVALLLGSRGAVFGWHEKQRLVPGGEFLPLVRWLPEVAAEFVFDLFRSAMGSPPDGVPGGFRPPLATASGVPFGALTCYDNAFPQPAAAQVASGAQFLCVISNEAWYRGGAELTQLVAMTVCRALEVQVPIVRCTMDGWSVAVDARGAVLAQMALQPAPQAQAQKSIFRVAVTPPAEDPVAWLRAIAGPATAIWLGLALLHSLVSWARLKASRTAPQAAPGAGVRSR